MKWIIILIIILMQFMTTIKTDNINVPEGTTATTTTTTTVANIDDDDENITNTQKTKKMLMSNENLILNEFFGATDVRKNDSLENNQNNIQNDDHHGILNENSNEHYEDDDDDDDDNDDENDSNDSPSYTYGAVIQKENQLNQNKQNKFTNIANYRRQLQHQLKNQLHQQQQPQQNHHQQRSKFYRQPNQKQKNDEHNTYTKEIVIKQGRLQGIVRTMHVQSGLKDVDQYLGIPYAASPVGKGRFMPPGAPPPWHGLKLTTNLSPVCPQNLPIFNGTNSHISSGRYDQLKRLLPYLKHENEDCLFLNLYVPKWDDIGPRPKYSIIVFIHGESYEWNSGNPYDGSVLSSYGQIIVITLNYRLGILGFLKSVNGDHTVSNFGLLDQIAALQWIKDNIGSFGGDNNAITLMGHGTGAACVNLLMISPIARGLFRRAILMSGSALSDWAIANHPLQATMQLVRGLNCPLHDENDGLFNCLRKKRYQEIVKAKISTPEFSTTFGPVVDNLVVPNQPQNIMGQYNDVFSRYDMLFGLTEIESYHILNQIGLTHGLLESERDSYLRFYMQNRFEIRPDIALTFTLQEYIDIYNNPDRPMSGEHRDTVLEILSDARVAAPLIQTGLYHAKVNPRNYMYVFAHNSKAGEYSNLPQSIVGEELPYIFGAPLASAGPFQTRYSPEEKLLSEAIMVYWTNFAKTGNPKAPWRDNFLNLHPPQWYEYDIDWPEFNDVNFNYLNIGIPPVVNKRYRDKYMQFWNQYLPSELNRTINAKPIPPYADLYAPSGHGHQSSTPTYPRTGTSSSIYFDDNGPIEVGGRIRSNSGGNINAGAGGGGGGGGGSAHINYYSEKSTEDPFRQLKFLMQHEQQIPKLHSKSTANIDELFLNTEQQQPHPHSETNINDNPLNTDQQNDNEITVKADTTLNILIGFVIAFLLLNVIIFSVYFIKRNYLNKHLKRKLDVLSSDGATTTDDDGKRSKLNADGDDSFIMDVMRTGRYNKNDYEEVSKRKHSPINGYLMTRQLSTSTMDAHTKVCDWMSQEIKKLSPKNNKKSLGNNCGVGGGGTLNPKRNSFKKLSNKKSVGIDATPNARTPSVLEQEPIELMKAKSFDYDQTSTEIDRTGELVKDSTIICQDIDILDSSLINPVNLRDQTVMGSILSTSSSSQFSSSSTTTLQLQKNDNDHHHHQTTDNNLNVIKIDHRHSRSDPVQMYYHHPHHHHHRHSPPHQNGNNKQRLQNYSFDENTTSFIENVDINVTSRDDDSNAMERTQLTPAQTLETIKMRNYPKVLPKYPNNYNGNLTSSLDDAYHHHDQSESSANDDGSKTLLTKAMKRRSLPHYMMNIKTPLPPVPPPRTTSTLGRKPSPPHNDNNINRDSKCIKTSSPLMMAEEPPEKIEPEITCNILHVGPILPRASNESIYTTLRQQQQQNQSHSPYQQQPNNTIDTLQKTSGIKPPSNYNKIYQTKQEAENDNNLQKPKIIIKPTTTRQTHLLNQTIDTKDKSHIPRVTIPSNNAPTTNTSSTTTPIDSKIPILKSPNQSIDSECVDNRSAGSESSNDTSSSGGTTCTVKKIY